MRENRYLERWSILDGLDGKTLSRLRQLGSSMRAKPDPIDTPPVTDPHQVDKGGNAGAATMNNTQSYVVVAHYQVRHGAADIVAEALREHGKATRAEPGCLGFAALRGIGDSDSFAIYEEYRSGADCNAHKQTPHYHKHVVETIRPLLHARDVNFYRPVGEAPLCMPNKEVEPPEVSGEL